MQETREEKCEMKRMVVCLVYSQPCVCGADNKVKATDAEPLIMLVTKTRPQWQAGKLNGPGGCVQDREQFDEAASRELLEETGLEVSPSEWQCVGFHQGSSFVVAFLMTKLPLGSIHLPRQTGEEASPAFGSESWNWYPIDKLPAAVVYDLRWLIPFSLDGRFYPAQFDVKPICEHKNVPDAVPVIGGKETDRVTLPADVYCGGNLIGSGDATMSRDQAARLVKGPKRGPKVFETDALTGLVSIEEPAKNPPTDPPADPPATAPEPAISPAEEETRHAQQEPAPEPPADPPASDSCSNSSE
jgi:8-oxo-dGTP pyrophosphatase MutT (NUDIX family)